MDKEKIIKVTFDLIVDNGLDRFSIGKLSNQLNCTKSSIYNYFDSKDDLLNEVFIYQSNLIRQSMNTSDNPVEAFRNHIHYIHHKLDSLGFFYMYGHAKFLNENAKLCIQNQDAEVANLVDDMYVYLTGKEEYNSRVIRAICYGPLFSILITSRKFNEPVVTTEEIDLIIDGIIGLLKEGI